MSTRVTTLPTRPETCLRAVVEDVAHARRASLSDDDLDTVTAIAQDILRSEQREDRLDLHLQEQAADEAVRAWLARHATSHPPVRPAAA